MIPMYKPLIEEEEIKAAEEALRMGWLGMGSYVAKFEESIKHYVNASDRYVAAVNTGHAALHLGLLVAGVGPGDEVITPSFNNVSDFQAILAVGAEPVFCDIDDNTLCIDLVKAEELVSPRTKAIIAMDYGCMLCEHDQIQEFANRHGVRVIHDAAHSFGSKYNGRMIGSFSDICMFSFDPVKTITCIDGGALVVRSEADLKSIQEMRLIGMGQPPAVMYQNRRAWTYDVKTIGFRYHMANLHAAIGLAQLDKFEKISQGRLRVCRYYHEKLRQIPNIRIPKTDFNDIVPFLYYIRVLEDTRDDLRSYLRDKSVDTGIHWQPGHWFTLFEYCRSGDLSVTNKVGEEIISLPTHPSLSEEDIDRVCKSLASYFMG